MLPSERVIVPRSAAFRPAEATGVAFVISGGQALAQAPEQLDLPLLSATHRYTARPEAPVRYVPSAPFAVLIETALAETLEPVEDVVGVAAAELEVELELLLPHAATSNDTPTSAAAALVRNLPRLVIILLTFRGLLGPSLGRVVTKDPRGAPILPRVDFEADPAGHGRSRLAAEKLRELAASHRAQFIAPPERDESGPTACGQVFNRGKAEPLTCRRRSPDLPQWPRSRREVA